MRNDDRHKHEVRGMRQEVDVALDVGLKAEFRDELGLCVAGGKNWTSAMEQFIMTRRLSTRRDIC